MEPLPPDGPRTPRFVVLHPRRPPWAPVCVAAVLVATVMAGQVAAAGLPTELGLLAGAVLALPALRCCASRRVTRSGTTAWRGRTARW